MSIRGLLRTQSALEDQYVRMVKRDAILLIIAGAVVIILANVAIWSLLGTAQRNSEPCCADREDAGARTMHGGPPSVHSTESTP